MKRVLAVLLAFSLLTSLGAAQEDQEEQGLLSGFGDFVSNLAASGTVGLDLASSVLGNLSASLPDAASQGLNRASAAVGNATANIPNPMTPDEAEAGGGPDDEAGSGFPGFPV